MNKFLKALSAIVIFFLFIFLIIFNFSTVEAKYVCNGKIAESVALNEENIDVYIILTKHRWWVKFWSESKGNLVLEVPNQVHEYYNHLGYNLTGVMIYQREYLSGSTEQVNKLYGNFSQLSKILALKTPIGFFDGKCSLVQE